jgi:ankyrin repeat protein
MHWAAKRGDLDMVQVRAHIDTSRHQSLIIIVNFIIMIRMRALAVFHLLCGACSCPCPRHTPLKLRGVSPSLQYLAERGAPLFAGSEDGVGMQPLHWAATEGHLSVMHFLVSKVRHDDDDDES